MSEWISVEDELPGYEIPVITVGKDRNGDFLSPVIALMRLDGKFIVAYKFNGDRVLGFFIETFPTHWMPLPEQPCKN